MIDDPIITVQHVRDAGLCVRGARQWLTLNGLSLEHLIRQGYPCSQIEALNDAMGNKVAKLAREQANEELK